jgi:hypothetical protein
MLLPVVLMPFVIEKLREQQGLLVRDATLNKAFVVQVEIDDPVPVIGSHTVGRTAYQGIVGVTAGIGAKALGVVGDASRPTW